MKHLLSAAALAAILSTPAMAEKTPVKPTPKPVNTCNEEVMLKKIVYHLDQIEMLMAEMSKDPLRQYKEPMKDVKTSG